MRGGVITPGNWIMVWCLWCIFKLIHRHQSHLWSKWWSHMMRNGGYASTTSLYHVCCWFVLENTDHSHSLCACTWKALTPNIHRNFHFQVVPCDPISTCSSIPDKCNSHPGILKNCSSSRNTINSLDLSRLLSAGRLTIKSTLGAPLSPLQRIFIILFQGHPRSRSILR